MRDYIEKVKIHIEKHKTAYSCAVTAIGVAGITALIMRNNSKPCIQGGISVLAKGGATVLGKSTVLNTVSYISSERQGPPSWVVRCVETGAVFTSQAKAALEMKLDPSLISSHLNGGTDHVNGYHFERICMAA